MGAYAFELMGSAYGAIGPALAQSAIAATPVTPDVSTWPNAYALETQTGALDAPHVTWDAARGVYTIHYVSTGATQHMAMNVTTVGIWQLWNTVHTQLTNQAVWGAWHTQAAGVNNAQMGYAAQGIAGGTFSNGPLTEEVRAALAAQKTRIEVAKKTAHELLCAHLTETQLREMEEKKFFTVIAKHSRRKYQIRTDKERHGNIYLLGDDNLPIASLCAAPGGNIPIGDAILGQKLMLEHAEEEFLQRANRTEMAPMRRTA